MLVKKFLQEMVWIGEKIGQFTFLTPWLPLPTSPSPPTSCNRGVGGSKNFGQQKFLQEMVWNSEKFGQITSRFNFPNLFRTICPCFSCYSIWDDRSYSLVYNCYNHNHYYHHYWLLLLLLLLLPITMSTMPSQIIKKSMKPLRKSLQKGLFFFESLRE